MKKFASLVLAMVMVLALAAPAFASDTTISDAAGLVTGGEVTITGTTNVPTIKVTVPNTGAVITNPYKLEYEVTAADEANGIEAVMSDKQIISAAQYIKNEGTTPLSVNVTTTGTPATGVTLATAPVSANTKLTTKSIFMYLKMIPATATYDEAESKVVIADPADTAWGTYDKSATDNVAVAATATTKNNVITIPAGTPADEENSIPVIPGVVAFRLDGDAVSAPAEAWTTTDTVNVTILFTFTSVAAE